MSSPQKVILVKYDPSWPDQFKNETEQIKQALGDNCLAILHIGSTSIPGLAAKPIIDVIPVVKDIMAVNLPALEGLGYRNRGELGMMFRRLCFKYGPSGNFHLHIWEETNAEVEKHIQFRQHLIDHPEDLKAYEELKQTLAVLHADDSRAYSLAKDKLIKEIIQKTGFEGKLIVEVLTIVEQEAYQCLMKAKPLIAQPGHYCFVLSKGTVVIGAARVEFADDNIALLKGMAIDENFEGQGFDDWFLSQLTRWVSQQGRVLDGAAGADRTRGLTLTKGVLYH